MKGSLCTVCARTACIMNEILAVLPEMTERRASEQFMTSYVVNENHLFRELGTEQMWQGMQASFSVITYFRSELRILQLCLCQFRDVDAAFSS